MYVGDVRAKQVPCTAKAAVGAVCGDQGGRVGRVRKTPHGGEGRMGSTRKKHGQVLTDVVGNGDQFAVD